MFFRRAWQRVGPLARWLIKPISKTTAPVRHMAFGPGGTSNLAYVVLCGGGLTAAVVYAYKTVNGDTERYEDRLANMSSKEKAEVTSEAVSPAVEPAAAEEEPAPGAEITAESIPASPEPVAETSAEPTPEAALEEPPAGEVSEADVTEASTEPADAEGPAPVEVEETAPQAAPEVASEAPGEDASATESAAGKALGSSILEIINSFVDEESLVNALHQMSADGNDLNSLEGVWESEALGVVSELSTKETAEAAVDREEENQLRLRKEEEEERAASFPEVEDNTMMPDSAPKEAISSSEAYPEDSFSSDEAWHAEEVIVTAEATKEEEETKSEEIKFGTVGKTTQLAAASTKPNLDVLSAAEPESPSSMGPVDKEEPCHNCHNCPPSSKAPPPALGEDMPAMDLAQEAKDKSSPLTKQPMENEVVATAQS
ncbi:fibrous sheath CABYR-binding protein [Girardinichthys multiradiatus]|uniref:fibrous sheath CABYR-binding protein n=1 Tax=Girardinichthys multiradiatus TaxID=208333 RepID=UPI001FAB7DD4|nr:fibrous sheath CABYR-binding protein [Girardinichthys multiradiatus]